MQNKNPISITSLVKLLTACLVSSLLIACSNEAATPSASVPVNKSQEKITLRLAHGWPKGFPYFAESVDDYAIFLILSKVVNMTLDKQRLITMVVKTLIPYSFHQCHSA